MTTAQLLQCTVCGGSLASTARACPKCGAENTWLHSEIERFKVALPTLKVPSATQYFWQSSVLTATSEHITEPGQLTIDFATDPPTVTAGRPQYWRPVLEFFDLAKDLPPPKVKESTRTVLYVGGLLVLAAVMLGGYKLLGSSPDSIAKRAAEHILKRSLNDPDSFKRRSADVVWEGTTASGKPAYAVRVDYSATNAYGGRIQDCNTVIFFMDGDNVKWNPADARLPCESGTLLERGDAKALEVLTEYVLSQ